VELTHASFFSGLDSHRYRCCGNGVVSNVSEWIGVRLARVVERAA
jgi:site-specific DNA-cytosine methylase